MTRVVHAFTDDALSELDAVGISGAIAAKQISATEIVEAAIRRAESADRALGAVSHRAFDRALAESKHSYTGAFAGVPTFVTDDVDVAGMPTQHGSRAFVATPAAVGEPTVRQLRATGVVILGKSTVPEFGLNASTEFACDPPTRNPWDTHYSAGGSSGGAAALVAAGVVPIAHGTDGNGSLRIPAAACGVVGLKLSRGREAPTRKAGHVPVNIYSSGVLTRTVRDTAMFAADLDAQFPARRLPPIGHVRGPSRRRLRIGVAFDGPMPRSTDSETRAAVSGVANLLVDMGHRVETVSVPADPDFAEQFLRYWAMTAWNLDRRGARLLANATFDRSWLDPLTIGLAREFSRHKGSARHAVSIMRRSTRLYRSMFRSVDVVLSPVVSRTTPPLGYLDPTRDFGFLFRRLGEYVGFAPVNNASGGPGIALPLARTSTGLPLGVHFSADCGDERTLLELAYELEAARPFALLGGA